MKKETSNTRNMDEKDIAEIVAVVSDLHVE